MNKPKIEYIQYYTAGSAAVKLDVPQPARTGQSGQRRAPRPVQKQVKPLVIAFDPVALLAITVAIIMVVLMGVGTSRLKDAQTQQEAMADYVDALAEKKQELELEFDDGYDVQAVKDAALALGMIPAEEAPRLEVEMDHPEPPAEEKPSLVDSFSAILANLLA